jgi:broad specificity phosphatase PhoE
MFDDYSGGLKKLTKTATMMIRLSLLLPLLHVLMFAAPSCRAMSTLSKSAGSTVAAAAAAATTIAAGGWSDVAIQAAQDFTVSQREKLRDMGALDITRPIRITGEPVGTENSLKEEEGEDNTKIIHFQRHGQGYHNLICDMMREQGMPIDFDSPDPKFNPVVRQEFLDPALTALGVAQSKARRLDCSQLNPELIIVSPLLRCLQTAKLSFRDHSHVPWISHEGSREELGLIVGNKRRPLSEIKEDYPEIDFSPIQHEEDVLWENYGDKRETLLEKSERIYDFLTEFVMKRPEKEIAIVCHSAYLFTLLNAVMDIEEEDLRYWFLTSEVRSVKVRFAKNNEEAEASS